ncbi:MAG: TIGR04283 family arsenosugar biosynthesis glycosyltransferase [Gemmatimonadaceae bacterium]
MSAPGISIIIPTYNEAAGIAETLARLRMLDGCEVVVVDGDSADDTVAIARSLGATVTSASRGRGIQMNHGATLAGGDILLFLHADTRLPDTADALIRAALREPAVIGGCFRLRFDDAHPVLRASAFLTRYSFRLFHYGDEAFFVRREVFEHLGGYRPFPLMEDLDLWLRMRRLGRLAVLAPPVIASARRFRRHGVVRQQLVGTVLVLLFLLGVSPWVLKRYYDDTR